MRVSARAGDAGRGDHLLGAEVGRLDEVREVPRPTWSGCFSATSSMSMPPMSLKSITGRLRIPSQTTPA